MSGQQMPARIWAERTNEYDNAWVDTEAPGCQAYVRSDIAERMAEALEKAEQLYKVGLLNAPDNLANQVVELRRSALSAFRSATQDTEARND